MNHHIVVGARIGTITALFYGWRGAPGIGSSAVGRNERAVGSHCPLNFTGPRRGRPTETISCREISSVWCRGRERRERHRTGCQASLASMRQREVCRQPGCVRPGSFCCGGARAKGLDTGVAASACRAR